MNEYLQLALFAAAILMMLLLAAGAIISAQRREINHLHERLREARQDKRQKTKSRKW